MQSSPKLHLFKENDEKEEKGVKNLKELVSRLEAEKRAISTAKYAEIEKRVDAESKIKTLEIENDKLKLRSIHTSGKTITQKRIKSSAVSDNWFTIPVVSRSMTSPQNSTIQTPNDKNNTFDEDRRNHILTKLENLKSQNSALEDSEEHVKENTQSLSQHGKENTQSLRQVRNAKTFRIRYSGDSSLAGI